MKTPREFISYHHGDVRDLFSKQDQEWIRELMSAYAREVAEKQRGACVEHYYNSDNKHGTLATIAETPLVTDNQQKK